MIETKLNQPRRLALDGIRGVAVLIVFLSHSSGRGLAPAHHLQLQGIGHIGVYLFFCLSSWLLTGIVLREFDRTGSICLRAYFLRRGFRIIPLYFSVVLAVFLYQRFTGSISSTYLYVNDGWIGLLKHLTFIRGETVFWTIPCEVIFYLLLPFIGIALAKRPKITVPILIVAAIVFSIWTVQLYYHRWSGPPFPRSYLINI